jgi:hypothetical protein
MTNAKKQPTSERKVLLMFIQSKLTATASTKNTAEPIKMYFSGIRRLSHKDHIKAPLAKSDTKPNTKPSILCLKLTFTFITKNVF